MSLEVTKPKISDILAIDPSITKIDIEGYRAVETWSKGPSARNPWISEYESWKKVKLAIDRWRQSINNKLSPIGNDK